jgi:hypothetical protein
MEGVSLRPSDAQAGGFLDDADVTFAQMRFVLWDYGGKAPMSIALKVDMEDDDGKLHEQYYSAGDPTKMQPSADGKAIVPIAGATGLNVNTNAVAFISSMVNAGFPEDKIGNDISVFDGLGAHVNQVAQPKRPGLKKPEMEAKTYLLVTKINRLPWEAAPKPVAKGAPPAAAKGAPAPGPRAVPPPAAPVAVAPVAVVTEGASDNGALVQKARSTVLQILAEKGGAVLKKQLPTEAFRTLSNDPDRNAIVTMVFQDAFIAAAVAEGAFAFDGQQLTLG